MWVRFELNWGRFLLYFDCLNDALDYGVDDYAFGWLGLKISANDGLLSKLNAFVWLIQLFRKCWVNFGIVKMGRNPRIKNFCCIFQQASKTSIL